LKVDNFLTRRINFTFRYVPEEHIVSYRDLSNNAKSDVRTYMETLAIHSEHFKKSLENS